MQGSSEKGALQIGDGIVTLDRYRWVIVLIFSAYCSINFFLVYQLTIIADITERFYNVSSTMTDASGLIYMFVYILLFIPIGRYIDEQDLRTISIISTGLTAFGNLLKFCALSPNSFHMIIISQGICGVAQVFMMGLPPKVAAVWFGSEEVSIACGIGVMGCQLGMALGNLLPTFIVPDTPDINKMRDGFFYLFALDNVSSIMIFIIVLFFFRPEPKTPPSLSQVSVRKKENINEFDREILRKCLKNKDFLLVLYSFGTAWGIWNCIGILTNEMFIHYFPNIGNILGIIEMIAILLGGVFGSVVFGYILDRTHEFKKLSVFLLTMNCLTWSIFIFFIQARSLVGALAFFLIAGFFGGSLAVTSFEYCTEVIFPLPEAFGTTVLSASIYFVSLLYTLIIEFTFSNIGFLIGLLIIAIGFGSAAFSCVFISSNFRRREANLSDSHLENYGAICQ